MLQVPDSLQRIHRSSCRPLQVDERKIGLQLKPPRLSIKILEARFRPIGDLPVVTLSTACVLPQTLRSAGLVYELHSLFRHSQYPLHNMMIQSILNSTDLHATALSVQATFIAPQRRS